MARLRKPPTLVLAALLVAVLASSCAASGSSDKPSGGSTAATTSSATAGASRTGVRLLELASFDSPTYATGAPGDPGRLFVVEKAGRIMVLLNGHKQASPFLDISSEVGSSGGEQGLLSVAFAPDYSDSGAFYVYYTDHTGNIHVDRMTRSRSDPDRADPSSAHRVLSIDHHQYENHDGGQLQFGPEGYLYIGVGDGGSANDPSGNGQNTGVLLAKLLRIAPKPGGGYAIPPANPLVGRRGARPEIWAYGLRNPWRFSFDRQTGALIVGDVGQDQQEEIDYAPRGTGAGANYGWSKIEGDRHNEPGRAPHAVAPVLVARHSDGYCAIIGGYVVRDRGLPGLYGRYLYGDPCHPEIEAVKLSAGHARHNHGTGLSVKSISSFGQDSAGRIYAVSLDGPVYRLAAAHG